MECRGNTLPRPDGRFCDPPRVDRFDRGLFGSFRISRNFGGFRSRKKERKKDSRHRLSHKRIAAIGVFRNYSVESVSNFIGRIFRHDTFFRRERILIEGGRPVGRPPFVYRYRTISRRFGLSYSEQRSLHPDPGARLG